MRILTSAVVNQHPEVLKAYVDCLQWQNFGNQHEQDFYFRLDPDSESAAEAESILPGLVEEADPKPEQARYKVTNETHDWNVQTFDWLAQEKQKILDFAARNHYDAVWLVDSDLLCDPGTLQSLIDADKPITSGVFWTRWRPDSPPLPQVWLDHPYELEGRGWKQHEFLERLFERALVQVFGLGACTLIRSETFGKAAFYPRLHGLPSEGMWQGEDRSFCIRAERNHTELWADAWPDIWHCYRPEDRADLERRQTSLKYRRKLDASIGDLVSFKLEPIEEPELSEWNYHGRGRLGAIQMLPEIEETLLELELGENKIIEVQFPHWYRIGHYRNQTRAIRVTLFDVKHWNLHPELETSWTPTNESSDYLTKSELLHLKKAEVDPCKIY